MATHIDTREEGDVRIVDVSGEVDMETSPQVRDAILKALKGTATVKVRLRDVEYIDSSGIAILIQGKKEADKAGAELALLDPSDNVRQVIELAMLQQVFTIEETGA